MVLTDSSYKRARAYRRAKRVFSVVDLTCSVFIGLNKFLVFSGMLRKMENDQLVCFHLLWLVLPQRAYLRYGDILCICHIYCKVYHCMCWLYSCICSSVLMLYSYVVCMWQVMHSSCASYVVIIMTSMQYFFKIRIYSRRII